MSWQSASEPPNNSRTVCVMKKSGLKGAVTMGLDFRLSGEWYNAREHDYTVLKWIEFPAIEE